MSFNDSPIRTAHAFRMAHIRTRNRIDMSRQQIMFMAYLIENGHVKNFPVRAVVTAGMSWELANQYLNNLRKKGYTSKQSQLWTITSIGLEAYQAFMKEFNEIRYHPFRWR